MKARGSSKRSGVRHMVMTRQVNNKKKTSRPMKRRSPMKRRMKRRSSSSSGSGVFNGKVFGYTIPGVSSILKNKTAQKAIVGAGLVSIVLSVAQLANQPQINRQLMKPEVRAGIALVGGDIPGAAYQYYKDGGLKSFSVGGGSSGGSSSTVGFA